MTLDIIWSVLRWPTYLLLGYIIYILYLALVKPFAFYMRYRGYRNVHRSPYFIPILGDLWYHVKDMNAGKVHYHHKWEQAKTLNNYDLKVKHEGVNGVLYVLSSKAMEEFISLMPSKIDKIFEDRGLNKAAPHGFINQRSTKKEMARRKVYIDLLNMNKASCFAKSGVKMAKYAVDHMKDGESINFQVTVNKIIFNMIISALFGEDKLEFVRKARPYLKPDGTYAQLDMCELVVSVANSLILHRVDPRTTLLPWVNHYTIFQPYKRDKENLTTFRGLFKELMNTCTDPNSLCYKVFKIGYTFDEILDDMVTMVVAGIETTSRTITTILFYLKKNPDKLVILLKELRDNGFSKDTDWDKLELEKLLGLDYLTCVCKEALRIDSPASDVAYYCCYDNVKICGVDIPKGTFIKPDVYTPHYDEKKWLEPYKFVPERHDPDSEFSRKAAAAGKKPDIYARRNFGHGLRSCPGKTLAFYNMRVVVTYLLSTIDYEVMDDLLTKEGVGFGLGSLILPQFKITKL